MTEPDRSRWREHVSAWRASGLAAHAFAKSLGVQASTLYYWSRQAAESSPKRRALPSSAPRLARVERTSAARRDVVIETAGLRICVSAETDRAALALVLDVLARGGSR